MLPYSLFLSESIVDVVLLYIILMFFFFHSIFQLIEVISANQLYFWPIEFESFLAFPAKDAFSRAAIQYLL